MNRVKVSEATGPVLDWMVAKAEGIDYVEKFTVDGAGFEWEATRPSTDWAQGGPIIEREGLAIWQSTDPSKGKWCSADARWMDLDPESDEFMQMPDPWHGPTALIAAMRCFVAGRLGDEVDVPELL